MMYLFICNYLKAIIPRLNSDAMRHTVRAQSTRSPDPGDTRMRMMIIRPLPTATEAELNG